MRTHNHHILEKIINRYAWSRGAEAAQALNTIGNPEWPSGISPQMAVRLSKAFGTSAESWLYHHIQYHYHLWHTEQRWKVCNPCRF